MLCLDLPGLGSPHWKIGETVKNWPQGFGVSCFDNTWPNAFGDPRSNLRRILNTGKCPTALVQGWWAYGAHPIAPLDVLKKSLPKWETFAKNTADKTIKLYFSHSCEYNEHSAVEVAKRVDLVRKLAPSWTPVNTPMHSPGTPGVPTEFHGAAANAGPGDFASYDGGAKGEGIYDCDANAWVQRNSDAVQCRLWAPKFNGTESGVELPANQRTEFPDGRFIKAIARLGFPEGAAPPAHFSAMPFAEPMLYKSFAEDMPGSQNRDNMPLIIVKGKGSTASVVTFDGKSIGIFPRFGHAGEYPGNLTRYYSGLPGGMQLYGAEIAAKALSLSGSEFVWFQVDDRFYGPVNPAFRRGFFRA